MPRRAAARGGAAAAAGRMGPIVLPSSHHQQLILSYRTRRDGRMRACANRRARSSCMVPGETASVIGSINQRATTVVLARRTYPKFSQSNPASVRMRQPSEPSRSQAVVAAKGACRKPRRRQMQRAAGFSDRHNPMTTKVVTLTRARMCVYIYFR